MARVEEDARKRAADDLVTRGTTGKGIALLLDGVRKQLEAGNASFDVGYVLVPLARGYPDLAVDLEEWLCVSGDTCS
jgi:hypothetical protein